MDCESVVFVLFHVKSLLSNVFTILEVNSISYRILIAKQLSINKR